MFFFSSAFCAAQARLTAQRKTARNRMDPLPRRHAARESRNDTRAIIAATTHEEARMAKKDNKKPRFVPVDEDDLKPGHRWNRPLQAPGITQVDFEERID